MNHWRQYQRLLRYIQTVDRKKIGNFFRNVTPSATKEDVSVRPKRSDVAVYAMSIATLGHLCSFLHVTLFALHVILFALRAGSVDHRMMVPITGNNSRISTALSLYSTILVAITQRLGMLNVIRRRQKLTVLADASSAWFGLGSALMGLWANIRRPAGIVSSAIIAVYSASIMSLHVVSGSIMSLTPFNQTEVTNVPTLIAWPSSSTFSEMQNVDWQTITSLVSNLGKLNTFNTQGLDNATLYDTFQQPNPATGTAQLNATTIGFDCGLIPKANMSLSFWSNDSSWELDYSTGEMNFSQVAFQLPCAGQTQNYYDLSDVMSSVFSHKDENSLIAYTLTVSPTMPSSSIADYALPITWYTGGVGERIVQTNALQKDPLSANDGPYRDWQGLLEGMTLSSLLDNSVMSAWILRSSICISTIP
ncbi:hypothetical protein CONPUDRAFT_142299 [Coniophora puteana RWD-64-598 SS2]|uniref:Uncharacterized protein n=1 Tax=Coniophora puteana (strain RWD-64-598) TaxID=741705 RepID=A0A5M3MY10_CONPW|nr:uncharacterized protein CONPUDRAFT_142299 [Coniophora puteana RWD-64-598 SS2]EIW83664.1 hypothetical protein CONPUDRAFT_142299 [Coniophora puteana RWD-64-598 SS2]